MHKLAGELLIPLTTVEERVVHIRCLSDAQLLVHNLYKDKRTMRNPMSLPAYDSREAWIHIDRGMAIHGSLSVSGSVRRPYWSLGAQRINMWRTRVVSASNAWDHGRKQLVPDTIPDGVAEEEQWISTDAILERASNGGLLLVLRRGVSFSELLHRGQKITEFISHNWSGTSVDLIRTLRAASVRCAWICTLAINQHAIPSLGSNIGDSPFYLALKGMHGAGRVVMVLDEEATALTRIWCVFEV
eukprot:CAMPEP_0194496706 /NCGR_PEP_ID=MMETSP0253-20130528/13890_1 /TAXON_ID=2966 /ORGANISM="Noctiluca scintillans" /LENGTH=243 /DNA_ID=CAMNT_0039338131 /DNA_START=21 /DNA_END=748 /DNA_ORIENTATION=-